MPRKGVASAEPLPPGAVLRLGSPRLRMAAQVGGLALSPDGKLLVACSADGMVRIWDTATASEVRFFRAHPWGGKGLAVSPDGKLLAIGSTNSTTSVWDLKSGKLRHRLKHPYWVESVAFAPECNVLAVGDLLGGVGIWDLATGKNLHQLQAHKQGAWALAFSPNGKVLASASYDNTAQLWDATTGQAREPFGWRGMVSRPWVSRRTARLS